MAATAAGSRTAGGAVGGCWAWTAVETKKTKASRKIGFEDCMHPLLSRQFANDLYFRKREVNLNVLYLWIIPSTRLDSPATQHALRWLPAARKRFDGGRRDEVFPSADRQDGLAQTREIILGDVRRPLRTLSLPPKKNAPNAQSLTAIRVSLNRKSRGMRPGPAFGLRRGLCVPDGLAGGARSF